MGLDIVIDGKSYAVDFQSFNAVTENGSIIYSFRDLGITRWSMIITAEKCLIRWISFTLRALNCPGAERDKKKNLMT